MKKLYAIIFAGMFTVSTVAVINSGSFELSVKEIHISKNIKNE